MTREFARRAAFLGIVAWVSLCLLIIGVIPSLRDQFSSMWVLSGLLGLASAVGLIEVVKAERQSHAQGLSTMAKSKRDELTGLPNRWEFDRLINIMASDAQNHDLRLALLLIDVDALQLVNQRVGYSDGDNILQEVARCVLAATRGADLVSRFDNDEFAVVLTDVDEATCATVMDRLCKRVKDCVSAADVPVTVSVGATSIQADDSVNAFVDRAQLALFRSKSEGGNMACYHNGEALKSVGALVRISEPSLRTG